MVFKYQLNIIKNDEFVDRENGKFFMRAELSGEADLGRLKVHTSSDVTCKVQYLCCGRA